MSRETGPFRNSERILPVSPHPWTSRETGPFRHGNGAFPSPRTPAEVPRRAPDQSRMCTPQGVLPTGIVLMTAFFAVSITETLSDRPFAT